MSVVIEVKSGSKIIARNLWHDGGMDARIIESCHSTWLFDEERMRFRRILKGGGVGQGEVTTAWRAYHALEVDSSSESFVVVLNAEGTRLLRSWRHTEDCAQCRSQVTAAVPLADVRRAAVAS